MKRGRPPEKYSCRAASREFGASPMTAWRYITAEHATKEAIKALAEAGMNKLKYRTFVGRFVPDAQAEAVKYLIEQRDNKADGKRNQIIDAYSKASYDQRIEFLDWLQATSFVR
jgi:hypothetical protein